MNQFISDTASALTAAAIVAVVVWVANKIRNHRLEEALGAALSTNGVGISYGGRKGTASFDVQVSNHSSAVIRVRSFVIMTDSYPIKLSPKSEEATSQNPLDNAVLQPEFTRRALSRGTIPDDDVSGSMLLPPMTLGRWETYKDAIGNRPVEAKHAYLVFEYPSLFGHSVLVRIKIDGERFALIKERFEELNDCALRGVPLPMPGGGRAR